MRYEICLIYCGSIFKRFRIFRDSACLSNSIFNQYSGIYLFVLAAVMVRAFKLPVFVHLVLLAFYGIAIELMQSTIPYRSASVADVVADFSGAASFFLLFGIYSRFKKNQNG